MDRKTTVIHHLLLAAPFAALIALVAAWNVWAGWAAITVAVTAALMVRPD